MSQQQDDKHKKDLKDLETQRDPKAGSIKPGAPPSGGKEGGFPTSGGGPSPLPPQGG